MQINQQSKTTELFDNLSRYYGQQDWWPATTPFAMASGAILTQSTNWNNANKALTKLANNDLLSPSGIHRTPHEQLAQLIRSSGYYNIKALRLKALASHIYYSHGDDFEAYLKQPIAFLRQDLLSIKGIGKETADAIILYAGYQAIFVIDEYTKRFFSRFGLGPRNGIYDDWQKFFHTSIPRVTAIYNEYHAVIVAHCKTLCKKTPECHSCFLNNECQRGKESAPRQ